MTWKEIVVGVGVSIAANLATEWLKRLAPRLFGSSEAQPIHGRDFWVSIPATLVTLATLSLVMFVWVVSTLPAVILVVLLFLVSLVALAVVPMLAVEWWESRRVPPTVTRTGGLFLPWAILLFLHALIPHYIALNCPDGPIAGEAQFSGRVVDPTTTVTLRYSRLGDPSVFVADVPRADGDGVWYAKLTLGGASGDVYQVTAVTANDKQSRACRVVVR